MSLPPYPRYKPSGVEWLGEVPAHWEAIRVGAVFRLISGGTPSTGVADYWDSGIPWVSAKDMKSIRIVDAEDHVTPLAVAETATSLAPAGSALIVARSGILKHTLPVAVAEREVAINQDIKGCLPNPNRINSYFFAYWILGHQQPLLALWRQQGATVESLNVEKIKTAILPIPSLPEQFGIAKFLDRETAKIDTLVAKKRTLIERLKEKRTALISRTVTRGLPPDAARAAGLDPYPKLKPSGIGSVGEVPANLRVKRLMHLTDPFRPIMYGIVLPGPDVPGGVPIVKGGDVKPGRLALENLCRTTVEIEAGYARSRLAAGDIVFSIRGTVGEVELVPQEISGANLTQDAARVAPHPATNATWLLYALKAKAIIDPLLSLSLGAAVRGVNIRDLKRVVLLVPPLNEQRAVADYLDRETTAIEALCAKVETAIERLHEYRASLITAAVTGRIDVRGAVA